MIVGNGVVNTRHPIRIRFLQPQAAGGVRPLKAQTEFTQHQASPGSAI